MRRMRANEGCLDFAMLTERRKRPHVRFGRLQVGATVPRLCLRPHGLMPHANRRFISSRYDSHARIIT